MSHPDERVCHKESGVEVTESMLDGMYLEANTYALASHFLWGLWAILQNEMSSIQFGFMEYGVSRFEGYFTMKERLSTIGADIN
ncbi:CHKA-like protein [Mya arenaria]|uniref:CHKA-like protein n=1 Tax=Mya arenaria TaxID=6604 RepID=A0ABY7E4I9_MYAAR|nr:CHKA-like protein [Mya arenaria]